MFEDELMELPELVDQVESGLILDEEIPTTNEEICDGEA